MKQNNDRLPVDMVDGIKAIAKLLDIKKECFAEAAWLLFAGIETPVAKKKREMFRQAIKEAGTEEIEKFVKSFSV